MTHPTHALRAAAALIAAATIAVLVGCTAQPTTGSATATTAGSASVQPLACPTRAEVAGLTAIPFSASTASDRRCTYATADDASPAATVTVRHLAGDQSLAALRSAAIGRGVRTADARSIAFDAFSSTTKQDCTVWFPATDGTASSVVARRSGASGAEACSIAKAVARLAGGTAAKAVLPTVALIAPRTVLGTATADQRWPWRIAQRTQVRIDRLTGSGYLHPSSASSFATVAATVPADSAAVVFVSGTAEAGASDLTVLRAVTRALSAAAVRAPDAELIVVGPVADATTTAEDVAALRVDLQAAAKIAGARYVDPAGLDGAGGASALAGLSAGVASALRDAGVTAN